MAFGKTHEYYPLIMREAYKGHEVKQFMDTYVESQPRSLLSGLRPKKKSRGEVVRVLDFFYAIGYICGYSYFTEPHSFHAAKDLHSRL